MWYEAAEDELLGFRIVRAISSQVVEPQRIGYKDYINVFKVFLDGKPEAKCIARFFFDQTPMRAQINHQDFYFDRTEELYNCQDAIVEVVKSMMQKAP